MSTPGAPSTPPSTSTPTTSHPTTPPTAEGGLTEQQQAAAITVAIVVAVVIVVTLIVLAVFLVNNPATAATVRDVFIIFMALEAMVIGMALVVLIVQMATLTNLLKNEIKPILLATQETVNTVRGTAVFVSENLTEPIMKLNSYVAGLTKIVETISSIGSIFRRL